MSWCSHRCTEELHYHWDPDRSASYNICLPYEEKYTLKGIAWECLSDHTTRIRDIFGGHSGQIIVHSWIWFDHISEKSHILLLNYPLWCPHQHGHWRLKPKKHFYYLTPVNQEVLSVQLNCGLINKFYPLDYKGARLWGEWGPKNVCVCVLVLVFVCVRVRTSTCTYACVCESECLCV